MTLVVAASPTPILQFFSDDGTFLVGGQLFTSVGGIPYPTYADPLGLIQHANPIILNNRGEIATSSGQSAQLYLVPNVTYTFALFDSQSNPIDTPTNIQGIPTAATITSLITNQLVGGLIYPLAAGETLAGIVPSDFSYPVGHVYRYGSNPFPGATDMTTIMNVAANAARSVGCILQVPTYDILFVSDSIDISHLNVRGLGSSFASPGFIQASSDQFDVLTINPTGFAFLEINDLAVDGGWDGVTAGQTGDTLSLIGTAPNHPYVVALNNCKFTNNKQRGIYVERGGYTSTNHVICTQNGLHALEIFGQNSDAATTFRDYGSSQFGGCPNGYGIKITNGVSCSFHDSILEETLGILIDGITNRALNFDGVYQEDFTVVRTNGLFITDIGAGLGLRVKSCFGGNYALPPFTNWSDVDAPAKSNSNIAPNSVPLASSIVVNSAGQGFATTTSDVTAAQLNLTPGNYRLVAEVQCIVNTSSGGSMQQLACTITTNAAASGISNATTAGGFVEGAAQTQSFGSQQDGRIYCETIIQVTNPPTASVIYYLRVHVGLTGTISEGYYGQLRAFLIN